MKKTTNQFCLDILSLVKHRSRALANVVMGLASQKAAGVVGLSESPVYHYQYSSIRDAIHYLCRDEEELLELEQRLQKMVLQDYADLPRDQIILQTDKTGIGKGHSPTLDGRHLISIPNNKVPGNRPLDIGYEYSFVNLRGPCKDWSLPLSVRRIDLEQTPSQCGVSQIRDLLSKAGSSGLEQVPMVINTLDSGYANATYLDGVKDLSALVSVVRFRTGTKVFQRAGAQDQTPDKCRKIFGQRLYLQAKSGYKTYQKHPRTKQPYEVWQKAITDLQADEVLTWEETLKNGRRLYLSVQRWNDLLMRTKSGIRMDDKPFTVLAVEAFDAQDGHSVFQTPMFLGTFGQQAQQLSSRQIYEAYRARYGIEPFFRFAKQNLLMDKLQSPVSQHLDNWMYILSLAYWLLFTARKSITNQPKKWQQYNQKEKQAVSTQELSPAQTHKAILPYLLSFEQTPFLPPKSKPGPGRQKGQRQCQRTRYQYSKKRPNLGRSSDARSP